VSGHGRGLTAAFAATSALNYLFSLAMGWLLLPGDFGSLAFAQTLLLVAGLVLQGGFPWSLARSLASGPASPDLIRGAVAANLALGGLLGGTVLALFWAGPLRAGFETGEVALLVAGSLPFLAFAAAARGAVQGVERFGAFALLQVVEVFGKAVFGLLLVLAGFGVAGAIWGFLLGAAAAAALGGHFLRQLGAGLRGPVVRPSFVLAAPMLGTLLALMLLLNWDLLMLKSLTDDRAVAGLYQAALVLVNLPYYLVSATVAPVLFVQLARHRGLAPTLPELGDALTRSLAIAIPLELALALAPRTALTTLFPDGYAAGSGPLRILAIGNVLVIAVLLLSVAMRAVGHAGTAARRLLLVVAIEPFVLAAVVPRWHASGAATVFAATSGVALLVLAGSYRRILHDEGVRDLRHRVLAAVGGWGVKLGLALALAGAGAAVAAALTGSPHLALGVGLGLYAAAFPGVLSLSSPRVRGALPARS
jgi:O-antigen/teichoic acid export membrane protein